MRLFQAPLDACLDSPFFVGLSVHGLHFTVYAPSIFWGVDIFGFLPPPLLLLFMGVDGACKLPPSLALTGCSVLVDGLEAAVTTSKLAETPYLVRSSGWCFDWKREREKKKQRAWRTHIHIWPTPHFMGRYTPFLAFFAQFYSKKCPYLTANKLWL